ncbi:MAG: hypothetical protein WD688_19320 [Candidatus Binatia bacterium]
MNTSQSTQSHLPITLYCEGRPTQFSEENSFARGGEGTIHDVDPHVGKVYFPDRIDDQRREKLHLLQRTRHHYPANVAAPLALLRNQNGRTDGYTMERKEGQLLNDLLEAPINQTKDGSLYLLEVFIDILETLNALHAQKVIIGDLNPNNIICAHPADSFDIGADGYDAWMHYSRRLRSMMLAHQASFIDFDSVQIQGFHCTVKMDRYTDPVILQYIETGYVSPDPLFSRETDWYAFATLLFEALMGAHPRTGVATDPAIPKTLAGRFEGGKYWVGSQGITPPHAMQSLQWLHKELLDWFRTYFTTVNKRPSPTVEMLQKQIRHIGGTPIVRSQPVHPDLRNHQNLTGDKSKVWGDANGLGGDVSHLRGDLANLRGHIAIWGTFNGLRGNINPIVGDCSCIRGDCSNIYGDVTGLSGDVSLISGDVTKICGEIRVTGNVSLLEGDISLIWGDINPKYRLGGNATGYEGDITALYGLLEAVKQFVRGTHYFGKLKVGS